MAMCFIAYHSPRDGLQEVQENLSSIDPLAARLREQESSLSLDLVCNFFWNIRDNLGQNCRHAEHNVLFKVTRKQIRNTAFSVLFEAKKECDFHLFT